MDKEQQQVYTHDDVIIDAECFKKLEIKEEEVILHPWLTEQCIGMIYGDRGIGKTWFGMSLLDAGHKGKRLWPLAMQKACSLFVLGRRDASNRYPRTIKPIAG